jgi:hypothetical protein
MGRPDTIYNHIEESLARCAALPPGWDSFGADPVRPDILHAVRELIGTIPEGLLQHIHVQPLSNGSIQLEWLAWPHYLEFEFESPTSLMALWWRDPMHSKTESVQVTDTQRIKQLLQWLHNPSESQP